jgi:DtxR family transcriptional regulator, Mn-dependent transcriptional regulator
MRLSQTEENYIKAIYKLSEKENGLVSTNDLSAMLQNRAASVTDMLGKLSKKDLITYRKYRGVSLTKKGNDIALTVIRKHRLWECFLVQKLKFTWDEIHEVAEQLEHIQSERLIERLEEFLEFPKHDPHGEPIPDAAGKVNHESQIAMPEAQPGDKVKVSKVNTEEKQFLQTLARLNIRIGSMLEIVEAKPGGVVVVKAARRNVTLNEDTARHIFVQRIER